MTKSPEDQKENEKHKPPKKEKEGQPGICDDPDDEGDVVDYVPPDFIPTPQPDTEEEKKK